MPIIIRATRWSWNICLNLLYSDSSIVILRFAVVEAVDIEVSIVVYVEVGKVDGCWIGGHNGVVVSVDLLSDVLAVLVVLDILAVLAVLSVLAVLTVLAVLAILAVLEDEIVVKVDIIDADEPEVAWFVVVTGAVVRLDIVESCWFVISNDDNINIDNIEIVFKYLKLILNFLFL